MSAWREVGMYVERRGHGSSLKKWTAQVWECISPVNAGRRIVAAEFRYEYEGETEAIYRLTSQDMTPVEAVQFAAALFNAPSIWADLCKDGSNVAIADPVEDLLGSAIATAEDTIPNVIEYTLSPA